MALYNTKVTDYGYKEKVQIYSSRIEYDTETTGSSRFRKKYENMSDLAKEHSDKRRLRYYKNKLHTVLETALMNTDIDTMITLTFRNPIKNYDIAVEKFRLYIKRLQYYCSKHSINLKYIATWEYQKARGDVFHFHFLANTGYLEHKTLEKLWGNGFVFISKIGKSERDRRKAIGYTLKYCLKEIMSEIENGEGRGKRYVFTSNNLKKPAVKKFYSPETIEDIIFSHMEDVISDGCYDMRDDRSRKIGTVDFVEYRK